MRFALFPGGAEIVDGELDITDLLARQLNVSLSLIDARTSRRRWIKGIDEPHDRNPPCEWCGTVRRGPSGRLRRVCMKCRSSHYCSQECLDAAWIGGHWVACGPATKMRCIATRPERIGEEPA